MTLRKRPEDLQKRGVKPLVERTPDGTIIKVGEIKMDQLELIAGLGATNEQIADVLGIRRTTIQDYMVRFPEIGDVIKKGKSKCAINLVKSLYRAGTGYKTKREQVVTERERDGSTRARVIEINEEVPANVGANIFLLKNWERGKYKDRWDIEVTDSTPHLSVTANFLSPTKLKNRGLKK
jgi:hypothetical protein